MQNQKKPHIGKLLREQLRKKGHSVVWLTEQTGYDRAKLYRIFKNSNIYDDDLWKISAVLKHDFFLDYSKHLSITAQE